MYSRCSSKYFLYLAVELLKQLFLPFNPSNRLMKWNFREYGAFMQLIYILQPSGAGEKWRRQSGREIILGIINTQSVGNVYKYLVSICLNPYTVNFDIEESTRGRFILFHRQYTRLLARWGNNIFPLQKMAIYWSTVQCMTASTLIKIIVTIFHLFPSRWKWMR